MIILISSEDIFELPKLSNLSSYCLLACCTIGWSSIWLAGWLNHCRVAAPEGKFKALVERLGRFTLQTSGRSNAYKESEEEVTMWGLLQWAILTCGGAAMTGHKRGTKIRRQNSGTIFIAAGCSDTAKGEGHR